MKRPSTFRLLAISALVSFTLCACDKTETMSEPQNESLISFVKQEGRGFTKGSILDNTNISECLVYGHYYTPPTTEPFGANFMNEVTVTKDPSGNWTYSPTRYWPANGQIEFIGYAPIATANNGLSNVIIDPAKGLAIDYKIPTDVTKQPDLVLAKTAGLSRVVVDLQFQRLLSKISFSVIGTSKKNKKIKSITITDLNNHAEFHSKDSDWYVTGTPKGSFTVSIADGTLANITGDSIARPITTDVGHLFMLPQTLSGVEIKVEVLNTTTNTTTTQIKKFPAGHKWEMGKSYNYLIDTKTTTELTFDEFVTMAGSAWYNPIYLKADIWRVTGQVTGGVNFAGLAILVDVAISAGYEIHLDFPDATDLSQLQLQNVQITSFTAENAVGAIGGMFPQNHNLEKVNLPKITEIKAMAFFGNPNLKEVNMPAVETIGGGAFQTCGVIESLSFPKVTSIGTHAFFDTPLLSNLEIATATNVVLETVAEIFDYGRNDVNLTIGSDNDVTGSDWVNLDNKTLQVNGGTVNNFNSITEVPN